MPPARKNEPQLRLDAIAWAWVVAWITVSVCLLTYRPFIGISNQLGPAFDDLARWLFDALGLGLLPAMAGGLTLILLYVQRREWAVVAIRLSGWLLLTLASAALADLAFGVKSGRISVYGMGGSIGAWLQFLFSSLFKVPIPALILCATTCVGLILVADRLLHLLGRMLNSMALAIVDWATRTNHRVALFSNRMVEAISSRWNRFRERVRRNREVIPLQVLTPIIRPQPTPMSILPSKPTNDISITTAPSLSQTPPPLRLLSEDDYSSPDYKLPDLSLLADAEQFPVEDHEQQLRETAALLEKTFADFNLTIKVVGIHTGPVITQYEIALETGLRLNKVTNLADDLALNLGVTSVRIVAPLPGRNTVGIEVPNEHRQTVRLKELILGTTARTAKLKLPIFLGKDVEGQPLVYDMTTMPHLLIAGRTGTGKSVCLNSIIVSMLLTRTPEECRMIMIDPKKVELSEYGKVPHLMHPVVTDDKKAEAILAWAVDKMEERYEFLRKARVRNIASYNELEWDEIIRRIDPQTEEERAALPREMPSIVIIVDEVGDLLMSMKKDVEGHIIRLAQKSRAAGIHLILATQKPTVDVITGLIKSNLPARICFQVASRADSAVVLDEKGAEKLLGMGDMLFLQPGTSTIIRAQGTYVEDREIERVVSSLEMYEPMYESELLNLKGKDDAGDVGSLGEKLRDRDALYEQAIEVVIREQRGSTSLLQRALGIGYGRASRLIDFMAEDGVVGSYNGSNARDVLISNEEWELRRQGA